MDDIADAQICTHSGLPVWGQDWTQGVGTVVSKWPLHMFTEPCALCKVLPEAAFITEHIVPGSLLLFNALTSHGMCGSIRHGELMNRVVLCRLVHVSTEMVAWRKVRTPAGPIDCWLCMVGLSVWQVCQMHREALTRVPCEESASG